MNYRWINDLHNRPVALIVPRDFKPTGYNFLTPAEMALQVGVNSYGAQAAVAAHKHKQIVRTIQGTMEAILIRAGRMILYLYDDEDRLLRNLEMCAGDLVLLTGGGHAMTFPEACDLVEIKQGPFVSLEQDKTALFAEKERREQ